MTLIWSDFARVNLQKIYDRAFEYSAQHAEEFISGIIQAPEILTAHPFIGRAVPEAYDPNVRGNFISRFSDLLYRQRCFHLNYIRSAWSTGCG
jgi:plasmid stabilization system protein ParE